MNTLTDEQYERVARYLDGEPVALSAEETALAAEVQAGQQMLARALPVRAEPELTQRLQRRFHRRRTRRTVLRAWGDVAVALAAAIVLVAVLPVRFVAPGPSDVHPAAALSPKYFEGFPGVDQMDQQLRCLEMDVATFRTPGAAGDPDESSDDDPSEAPRLMPGEDATEG
jgi:hypothetical protein